MKKYIVRISILLVAIFATFSVASAQSFEVGMTLNIRMFKKVVVANERPISSSAAINGIAINQFSKGDSAWVTPGDSMVSIVSKSDRGYLLRYSVGSKHGESLKELPAGGLFYLTQEELCLLVRDTYTELNKLLVKLE